VTTAPTEKPTDEPTDKSAAAQRRIEAVEGGLDRDGSDELSMPLDLLLADAGRSPVRRFLPGMSGVRFTAGLARRPQKVLGRTVGLALELAKVGIGRSEVEPHAKDRRFSEEAWARNPLFKRTLQGYLAWAEAMRGLVDDAELGWGDEQRMGFIIDNLVEATSPSNNPFLNPKVLKRTLDTGGGNLAEGGRRLVRDFATAPRVPSMVEPDAFEVGVDIAVTPGAVVFRTDVFELIQYTPQTSKVRQVPLLIVPPTINKYYVIDLAEQRSLVEHLVQNGQQVYCISWRNPDARHADWGLDTYGQAILEAMQTAQDISRQEKVAMLGICSGGMIASMVLAHLADVGELDRVAAYSLAVTVLDQEQAGLPSALLSHKAAAASTRASREKGYLDGRALAEIFAWLRPNDLIWNYWVNNYLMGHAPKAFDILYWNADPVRMTAAMHRDFMDLAIRNALTEPGASQILGSKVDLSKVDVDSYVVAGIADHLCKWESCYRTTQLLGGDSRFVLSTSGHIAAMVNPPGNEKASFQTADENPPEASDWLAQATKVKGSWWEDYVTWLAERTGDERPKPRRLGSAQYEPLHDAPGTYVHDR
jgi:class II poly(R)-hydroxyalkanoic acid synthase